MRGVIDPLVSIGGLVERDRPAVVHAARDRTVRRAANGGPGFARDAAAAVAWGAALFALVKVASRFRRR
jgi:hypothetical protein